MTLDQARQESPRGTLSQQASWVYDKAAYDYGKVIVVLVALAVWQLTALRIDEPLLLPGPIDVARSIVEQSASGALWDYTTQTMKILLIALVVGIVLATGLSFWAILSIWGRNGLEAVASMLNPLPGIALVPLALVWFGIGDKAIIFVTVHSVVWALAVNMLAGFVTVPETLRMVGANLGLKGWRLIRAIYIPAALPYIVTGLKVSWAYAWRTIIAAELVFGASGSQGGLGWMIYKSRYHMDTAGVFAGMAVIIVLGLAAERGFALLENRTIRKWGMSS